MRRMTNPTDSLIHWTEVAEKYPSILKNEIQRMKDAIAIMEKAMEAVAAQSNSSEYSVEIEK